MRKHKFLVLIDNDMEWIIDEHKIEKHIADRIYDSEEPAMVVIECYHEKFEDNCIEINDCDFVQDTSGALYGWLDWKDKLEVIKDFE